MIAIVSTAALAASPSRERVSMVSQFSNAPRATASKNQIQATAAATVDKSSIKAETPSAPVPPDRRDKEKQACIANNIGIGNTFVWASRYSNTNDYSSMVEDTENFANNVCFVRVELKSDDSKINVSDIPAVYYEMGRNITCGSWTDSKKIESRILDAKKSARTWGTVAGVVGGAGIGVGAMELFGNKLIGGSVQGQKGLNQNELLRSQLLVLKDKEPAQYDLFMSNLRTLKKECDKFEASGEFSGKPKPLECTSANYEVLVRML
ncbi:MAG: hypothetical protein LBD50_00375 [Rickettsiales bacterium]|nr:hypothetical protein [Rickettsiales bacterium]